LRIVVRAFRIGRQPIRQLVGQLIGHGFAFLVHSRVSISLVSPSGFAVGACRATTLPERSTRNLVKFHLIDGPNSPDFALFRYWYSGWVWPPLTSILENIGNVI